MNDTPSSNLQVSGRTWKFGDHINTDLILPGPVMLLLFDEQPKYAFAASRPGWVDAMRLGDVLIGGHNFGTESGRPAARSLKVLGISCIVAESINGLFFRNCVNYGLFAMECPGVSEMFTEGDDAEVDFATFTVRNTATGKSLEGKPFPAMLLDIMIADGIYALMETRGMLAPPNLETA